MDEIEDTALPKWCEKIFPHHFRESLLAYCPTMGLVAVVTLDEHVEIYRVANGQYAFGLKRSNSKLSVDAICWKYNGQHLAIAWDNGNVDVLSTDTGKIIHREVRGGQGATKNQGDNTCDRVTCLDWGLNFIDVARVKSCVNGRPKGAGNDGMKERKDSPIELWDVQGDKTSLDDLLGRQPDLISLGIVSDLPEQLALTDIETLLPKLSVLPTITAGNPRMRMMMLTAKTSEDETPEVFSSQASLDTLFHSHHLRDHNAVDILLSCYQNKAISAMIYDSLEIGRVTIPEEWRLGDCRIQHCVSHPYTTNHSLLIEYSEQKTLSKGDIASRQRIAFATLNIRFIQSAGMYLPMIVSKTTQLQNLLKYIHQTVKSMVAFWQQAKDLPSRFIRNISESLAEKSEPDLVQSLYHLAMTGDCPPTIKEWLVDELAESGHKRWDHSMGHGYTRILELTHENLCPALDRITVVLTTLRGLASYHDGSSVFNVPTEEFTRTLELVRCLRFLANCVLIAAADERRQFSVFSRWLRHEIDVQGTGASSSSAEELENKDAGIDFAHLLVFIQGGLTKSSLQPYLKPMDLENGEEAKSSLSQPAYEQIVLAGEPKTRSSLLKSGKISIPILSSHLNHKCETLFAQIASWQVSTSAMEAAYILEEERMSSASDMRMAYVSAPEESMNTYIALVPTYSKNEVRFHHITQRLGDRQSPVLSIESTILQLPAGGIVRDVKFADDHSILVLFRIEDGSLLLRIPLDRILNLTTETSNAKSAPLTKSAQFSSPSTAAAAATTTTEQQKHGNQIPNHPRSSPKQMLLPNGTPPNPSHRPKNLHLPGIHRSFAEASNKKYVIHTFKQHASFAPARLVVNTRENEQKSVVVVAEEGRSYRIFGLGDRPVKGKEEEGKKGVLGGFEGGVMRDG